MFVKNVEQMDQTNKNIYTAPVLSWALSGNSQLYFTNMPTAVAHSEQLRTSFLVRGICYQHVFNFLE